MTDYKLPPISFIRLEINHGKISENDDSERISFSEKKGELYQNLVFLENEMRMTLKEIDDIKDEKFTIRTISKEEHEKEIELLQKVNDLGAEIEGIIERLSALENKMSW